MTDFEGGHGGGGFGFHSTFRLHSIAKEIDMAGNKDDMQEIESG